MEPISSFEEHGGIDPAELKRLGVAPAQLIDFSVNSNPFGPSPHILEALRKVDLSKYPDRNCGELSQRLATLNHAPEKQVLVGNGTAELIWLAAHALLKPGEQVTIVGPTFGEYCRAAAQVGAAITEIRAQPPDFIPPIDAVIEHVRRERPRLVFLCNPNNPTGKLIHSSAMARLIETCGAQTLLVLDEAYSAFVSTRLFGGNGRIISGSERFFGGLPATNCLVLRSMTKDFALAGLRLGYALGNPAVIEQMRSFQPAWSVNAFAQAAGLAALNDLKYYQQALGELNQLYDPFFAELKARGCRLIPSDVHFALIDLGSPARQVRMRLLQSAIQVRDCASFGLPDYIRVSTQLAEDNQKLLAAIQALGVVE